MKQPMIQNQHGIRTAAYCRLSKDDEQIGESASIQTQRDMILYHIRQKRMVAGRRIHRRWLYRTEHQPSQLPADASGY